MSCPTIYTRDVSGCAESITLDMGLTGEQEYTLIFSLKSGNKYTINYTTDIDGVIVLEQSADIAGFWTYADGLVTWQIFQGNKCNPEIIDICGVEYDTFCFNFTASSNTGNVDFVCECDELT